MSVQEGERLQALEGLRGVAAIIVVLFHGLSMFYPSLVYGTTLGMSALHHSRIEDVMYGNPLSVITSGAFAVAIFFVLSGFVLSIGYFNGKGDGLVMRIAGKRYLRLMLPAFSSIVITFLVVGFGLSWLKNDTATITGSLWLAHLWPQTVSIVQVFSEGLWNIFFGTLGAEAYNPVLWTMRYELLGSLLVFAVILLFGKAKNRWAIYSLLIFATFQTWYLAFVTGMILADLYSRKKFPFVETKAQGWLVLILLIGLFLGGYPYSIPEGSIYAALQIPWLSVGANQIMYLSLGATAVLTAVISLRRVSSFFASKRIYILGKYSFSIYLVHMAVLFTVAAGVFLLLHPHMYYGLAVALALLATCIVLVPAVYIFERYVDTPSIRVSGLFANWLFGEAVASKNTSLNKKDKSL